MPEDPLKDRVPRGSDDQIIKATVFVGYRTPGDGARFVGSAFIVADDRRNLSSFLVGGEPQYVVTAKHVIARLAFAGAKIVVAFPNYGAPSDVVDLPSSGWTQNTDHDVAVYRYGEFDARVPKFGSDAWSAIGLRQFRSMMPWAKDDLSVGSMVRMIGLWTSSENADESPIIRTGFFAALSQRQLQLETGKEVAYLVDGVVTRGMSGGPSFLTSGAGSAQNAILGLIHGFWPIPESDLGSATSKLEPASVGGERTGEERARVVLLQQLEAINSSLVLVIPDEAIIETITKLA